MGRKLGWLTCPFGGRGAGSPSNTMWPWPRPTCMPSFILIRPTVWPQCTNVTDRQDRTDRTDNGLKAYGEPFYKRSPKSGTTSVLSRITTGRGTEEPENGASWQKRDGWQPYTKLSTLSSAHVVTESWHTTADRSFGDRRDRVGTSGTMPC